MVKRFNSSIFLLIMAFFFCTASISSGVIDKTGAEPSGGTWQPILLASGDSIRSPPPCSSISPLFADELKELREAQAKRTPDMNETIEYWNNVSSSVRWNEIARDLVIKHKTDPPMASRIYALLSVAQYDALVVAWNNKYYYNRSSPQKFDPSITLLVTTTDEPTYPSEDAVIAAASAAILSYAYPEESVFLEEKANESKDTRLWAGANFPSDISAGDMLERAVALKVVEYAKADGSDAVGNITTPVGPQYWVGDNPLRPLWGKVKPWTVDNISIYLPSHHPSIDSEDFEEALAEVREVSDNRTDEQLRIAVFWSDGVGTYTPPGHWNDIACRMIKEDDLNELRSARALGLMNIAIMDAGINCWDTKFYYWLLRPWMADGNITTPVGKPPFPLLIIKDHSKQQQDDISV
jgi:hypothetical protein